MARKIYVGLARITDSMTVFRAENEPTFESTGEEFAAVIGPFRTLRGAKLMALYGAGNPHMQTVADCEYLAKTSLENVNPKYGDIPAKLPPCPVRKIGC